MMYSPVTPELAVEVVKCLQLATVPVAIACEALSSCIDILVLHTDECAFNGHCSAFQLQLRAGYSYKTRQLDCL